MTTWEDLRKQNSQHITKFVKLEHGDIVALRAVGPESIRAQKNRFGKIVYRLQVAVKRGDEKFSGDCEFSATMLDKLLEDPTYYFSGDAWGRKFKVIKRNVPGGITVVEFEEIE